MAALVSSASPADKVIFRFTPQSGVDHVAFGAAALIFDEAAGGPNFFLWLDDHFKLADVAGQTLVASFRGVAVDYGVVTSPDDWASYFTHDALRPATVSEVDALEDHMRRLTLFLCLPNHCEPDWSRFVALEINGCRLDDGPSDDDDLIADQPASTADIFAIFGITGDGGRHAITETVLFDEAVEIAEDLGRRSGLAVVESPRLSANVPAFAEAPGF